MSSYTRERYINRPESHSTRERSHGRQPSFQSRPREDYSRYCNDSPVYRPASTYASRRWPPQPYAEDELSALRREAGSKRPQANLVPERGTIDQDPILIDVESSRTVGGNKGGSGQSAVKKTSASSAGHVHTPPTSDDERAKRGRRHGATLDTGLVPEMQRAPSPYNFSSGSKTETSKINPVRSSTSYPTVKVPVFEPAPSRSSTGGGQQGPRRPSKDPRSFEPQFPQYSSTSSSVIDGPDFDDTEANERRAARRTNTNTQSMLFAEPEAMSPSELPTRPALRPPRLSDDNRRHTDSYMDTPREAIVDSMRKPVALKVASLVREASGGQALSTPARSSSSRASTRASTATPDEVAVYPPSPPRSPRLRDDLHEHTHSPKRNSIHSSAEGSYASSPQASPKLTSTLPATTSSWQHAFETNAARTTRPTNLATSTAIDDIPDHPHRMPAQRAGTLPYPVHDFMTAMPDESQHQYFPEGMRPVAPSPMIAKTLSQTSSTNSAMTAPPLRPALQKHHTSFNPVPPVMSTPLQTQTDRSQHEKKTRLDDSTNVTAGPLPPCPRSSYKSGYTDWYSLTDCPNLDICPDCVQNIFSRSYHRHFVELSPRTAARAQLKIRCDFADQWMRMAWLLTLQRELPNLGLLKQVHHHLNSAKVCPDTEEAPHQWFTIVDDETFKPLRGFHVCATDVKTVEILLPQLRGFFTPYPSRNSVASAVDQSARLCSFRTTTNNRFPLYLDSLISLHEGAVQARSPIPDMTPFTKLVKRKLDIDECSRDNIMQGGSWYFIPSLPEFSVCEDCHDDIIAPLLRTDTDLAMRFNRTLQTVPQSSAGGRSPRNSVANLTDVAREASCTLYSARLRRVFKRAVEGNDLKYLSRKAKERKDTEVRLQRQAQPMIGRLKELADNLERYEGRQGYDRDTLRWLDERRRLGEELALCREEWADWE